MPYIGNTNTTQAFTPAVDFFNGNGSTTAFTLSRPVASVAQVQAVIENVPQNPGDAFTVSGNTITFTSAPPSGTSNIYVYYTSPITQVIAPGQGTVGTSALVDSAVTTEKIAAGAVVPADLSTGGPSWTSAGLLSFNSGYGSNAVAYGCRAWVNFNGTGTVAIRASGNVTSITDNGTGNYTVNFTTAMSDANYSVAATGDLGGAWYGGVSLYASGTYSTTQVQIATHSDAGSGLYQDFSRVCVHIFR